MAQHRIVLTLTEPLTLSAKPVVSNEIHTLQAIPATALRGAFAAELAIRGRSAEIPHWFGTAGPRWTPALPESPHQTTLVPMPLSLVVDKGDKPFHGAYAVFNTLAGPPPDGPIEYHTQTGILLPDAQQRRFQWSAIRSGWLELRNGTPVGVTHLHLDATMHVGLHYGRQANREQVLFSRREIPAGTRFVAWVDDPANLTGGIDRILLGKRRSAGNGAATVEWIPSEYPWQGTPVTPSDLHANVQFISDAIIPHSSSGGYLRGLGQQGWRTLANCDLELTASASAFRVIPTWSGAWGTPREQVLAISAGSVFRLKPKSPDSAPEFAAALNRIATEGVGIRRHEGYGWVAVNPSWLAASFHPPTAPRPTLPETLQEDADTRRQRQALHAAETVVLELASRPTDGAKDISESVRRLAAYAARIDTKEQLLDYLARLSDRTHARGWDRIQREIEPKLSSLPDLQAQQLFLDALQTLLNPNRTKDRS